MKLPALNISVPGATIPLEFIWGRVDRWILGTIYTIEGIISESEQGIIIDAWCAERGWRWRAKSSSHSESDPLRTALRSLADQVRESVGYYQELAVKFEAQLRYGLAIFFCQKLNKIEQGATLGYLYFNAGRLGEAELEFKWLQQHEQEEFRAEALRGLALVKTARGEYAEASALLTKVHGPLEMRAKLDEVTVLCCRRDFEAARENLKNLASDIERDLQSLLRAKRPGLAVDVLESKLSKLTEEEWIQIYNALWNLAELYGSLGRTYQELDDPEESKQSHRSSVEVLNQLFGLEQTYHRVALDLGVRLEDLAQYDEAMISYQNCIGDAKDHFQEDPDDIFALTNIAWAIAGIIACLVKKLDRDLPALDSQEARQKFLGGIEELANLLQDVPEKLWHGVVIEAVNQSALIGERGVIQPIGTLSEAEVERLLQVIANLLQVIGSFDLPALLENVRWIVDQHRNDQLAQEYFWQLVQQPDTHHIAEGYFGLACVDAICSRYDRALAYLELAIAHAPEFKNRARLDEDLRILRGNQIFKQLIEWDGGSIIRDQQRETEFCSDGDQKNSESVS